MRIVSKNLVASAFSLATLTAVGCVSHAQEPAVAPVADMPKVEMITPDQWLKRQPKPIYKPGHTLPRLTYYGHYRGLAPYIIELTENWHYVLETMYLSDETVKRALTDPKSDEYKMVALTLSDPKKYPLAVVTDRSEPVNPVPETFLRDAEGKLIKGQQIYSPLSPQSTLDQMAELRARPLRELRKKVPIHIILNGGEYGLGVLGFGLPNDGAQDPKVVAARGDQDWFDFLSKAKAREMNTIADAVRKAVPDRRLYIYYHSGNVERNRFGGWKDWSHDNSYALNSSDLPSNELYYKHFNDGYMSDWQSNDLLTRALNATGFQIKNGKKYSYDWLSGGWENEADPNAAPAPAPVAAPAVAPAPQADAVPQYQEGNAAALVDPNAGGVSPMNLYTGFLKCIFTAGTLGGNAGYYELPGGGFDGTFPADKPKHYLPQMTALSQVQALFSHLETDVRGSDLLPGPNKHVKSTDQPAYEFPTTGAGSVRVLARKLKTQNKWLVTAWAADGIDRPVKVTIPELGEVTLLARAAGSVYTATLEDDKPQLLLNDVDAMLPTVKGFNPKKVTSAQILAEFKAPVAPQMQNLLVGFDAAKGIEKDENNAVLSWKPQGEFADWAVTSSREGKEKVNATQPLPLWVADAGNGLPAVRFSGNQASLMSGKLNPVADLKEAAMTIFVVYAGTVPQGTMSQNGGNNSILRFPSGSGISNGPWPDPAKPTWQMRMAVEGFKGIPEYFVVGGTFWGPQNIASDFYFSGDIAELLVYRGDLPTAQKVQAELYLKAKYKLGD